MTSIYTTTDRLIAEHLDELLTTAWQPANNAPDTRVVRLVGAALSLVQQHIIDDKGRCRFCTHRRSVRRTRLRPCTVYSAMSFYLTQPDELVLSQIPRPRQVDPAAATTLRLPKLS